MKIIEISQSAGSPFEKYKTAFLIAFFIEIILQTKK